jgi:hypothetical protein
MHLDVTVSIFKDDFDDLYTYSVIRDLDGEEVPLAYGQTEDLQDAMIEVARSLKEALA